LVGKPKEKRPLERPMHGWEDNIMRKSQKVTLIFFLLTEYVQIGLKTLRHFST
jgi:hypothetical protein